MLTAYFLVLAVVLALALIDRASRIGAFILSGSWAVSFVSERVGLRDMAVFVDGLTLWALLYYASRSLSQGAVNAAHFVGLMIGAHLVYELTYRLGWYVPGMYMWTLNLLFFAATMSLIVAGDRRFCVRKWLG